MLTSLEIKNFRTFAHLRIERLGQVNLILGKNNVGKTTLLEALQIYGSQCPEITIGDQLYYRGEVTETNRPWAVDLSTLFHGRYAEQGTTSSIGPVTNSEEQPTLRILASIPKDENYDALPASDRHPPFSWGPQFVLKVGFVPGGRSDSTLYPDRRTASFTAGLTSKDTVTGNPKPLLLRLESAQSTLKETADRWDSLALTPGEPAVIDLLQRLAPIRGVRYVGTAEHGRTALVQLEHERKSERVPMMSLGEGIVHMFQLAVGLQFSARVLTIDQRPQFFANVFPLLLIDEFEIGIHYTLHAEVWRFVLKAAHDLGVQVFATTHSLDCVKGFAKAVQDVPECDALAMRIERSDDRSRAVSFTPEEMKIVAREEIEVR